MKERIFDINDEGDDAEVQSADLGSYRALKVASIFEAVSQVPFRFGLCDIPAGSRNFTVIEANSAHVLREIKNVAMLRSILIRQL